MEVDTNLVIHHLGHQPFTKLSCVRIDIGKKLGVLKPGGIQSLVQVFELLVEL